MNGMQQLAARCASTYTSTWRALSAASAVVAVQARLGNLDVPVAVHVPDEVLHLLRGQAQLELVQVVGGVLRPACSARESTHLSLMVQLVGGQAGLEVLGQVHQHKAGGVPQLVGKVAAGLHLFVARSACRCPGLVPMTSVRRRASAPYWSMTSSGSMPLPRDLGHLAALGVAHQAVDEHGVERGLARVAPGRRRSCGPPRRR